MLIRVGAKGLEFSFQAELWSLYICSAAAAEAKLCFSALEEREELRARHRITFALCCRPPGPLARRERRAYPLRYVRREQRSQRACGPQPEGAVCVVGAPRRCTAASPASRRLASGPSALAPKCKCYSVAGPKFLLLRSGRHD